MLRDRLAIRRFGVSHLRACKAAINLLQLYSCCSLGTLASDINRFYVSRAIDRFVAVVNQLVSDTPLFISDV
jgi:hypothetical protein